MSNVHFSSRPDRMLILCTGDAVINKVGGRFCIYADETSGTNCKRFSHNIPNAVDRQR